MWSPPHHSSLRHGCGGCRFLDHLFGQSERAETLCLSREFFTRLLLFKLQARVGWFQQRFGIPTSGENPQSNFIYRIVHILQFYLKGPISAMRQLQRT